MTNPLTYICPKCEEGSTHKELAANHMACPTCNTPYVYTWRSL